MLGGFWTGCRPLRLYGPSGKISPRRGGLSTPCVFRSGGIEGDNCAKISAEDYVL